MRHTTLTTVVLAACLALGATARPAQADNHVVPPSPAEVGDRDGRKLVAAFDKAVKEARREDDSLARREGELDALHGLAGGRHGRVARRLVELATDDEFLADTRIAALGALPLQGDAAGKYVTRLEKWLRTESESAAKARAAGDIGVPLDRSGDPIVDTPEARAALQTGETRARVLAAGIATLSRLSDAPKRADDLLRPFLQSPHDDLVLVALAAAGTWDVRELREDVALLLRMYPRENRWETGAVTHLGGTNASAKAAWMSLFGHPLKQMPRPAVHRAVVERLTAWAGTDIRDAAALDAWLAQGDG